MTIEETKSKLDILFSEVKAYRKSKHFAELLGFCAKFKTLAPYNAMLVHLQRPHARFVLTPSEWRKYNRKVRAHARPLVILVPFGPVDFVFEIQDTYTPRQAPYEYGETEIILFPNVYEKYSEKLFYDSPIIIYGFLKLHESEMPKIICDKIELLSEKNKF